MVKTSPMRFGALMTGLFLSFFWPVSSDVSAQDGLSALPRPVPQEVDVSLVLAIDVSGSIDYREAELQRKGFVDAFQNKEVLTAIRNGSLGRIGVSVVYFSSKDYGFMSVPVNWMVIEDEGSAQAFIKQLVAAEDGKRPLSDSKISEILGQQGIMVARRTIAKYREELKIPTSNQRKVLY